MKKKRIFTNFFSLENKKISIEKKASQSETWIHHILPADAEVPQMEDEKNLKPFLFIRVLAIFLFFVMIAQLFFLQIRTGGASLETAEGNRVRSQLIIAPRGIIYDKNGVALVKNVPNYEVFIVPSDLSKEEKEREEVYKALSDTLGMPVEEIKQKINEKGGIKYQLPLVIKSSVGRDTAILLESRLSGQKGVTVQINPIREYFDNGLLSHVLGYTGRISEEEYKSIDKRNYAMTDYIGKTGLEYSYESYLKGVNGRTREEIDATGKVIKALGDVNPENGSNLLLSIDFNLQKKMAEALRAGMDKANATKGVAIAMNPKNGEILGIVNLPSYDNNLFAKGISEADYKNLLEDKNNPLLFRAVSGIYPSGSIIKPFIAAGALQEGNITENSTVLSTGGIKVGDWEFPDWKAGGHGVTNVIKAIAESVNTFFYAIGGGYQNIKGLGPEKIKEYLVKFGFNKITGIDVPGEAEGKIPDPNWKEREKGEPWYLGDTYHMSIGQGDLLVTPLQMVTAASAIANGGTLYKPKLVSKIIDGTGGIIKDIASEILNKDFISRENLDIVRRGLRETVVNGSARSLNDLPVEVAAKTGTAQYSNDVKQTHAWFEAFAPYSDPEIAVVVLVEQGGGGDVTAAPVAKEILKWYFEQKH
ncbi:MAG: penicillin-binding protein 2 [Patescibacteria group bacterium]|nr:penicillin-binding protein 2 [Patescibacteria group bacterium]MCL5094183.1 penicillin-binding protein 2 [Patescibacteria group bacterium]